MDYAGYSFETLPENIRMTKDERIKLKIAFDRNKTIETGKLQGKELTALLTDYSKAHKFTINLEPEFLLPLASPYFSILGNFVRYIYYYLPHG
jgi:hypothetical protein